MQNQPNYHELYDYMLEAFDAVSLNYFVVEIECDHNGKPVDIIYRDVSSATARLIGKIKKEIIGKSRTQLLGNVSDEFPAKLYEVIQTGKPVHFQSYGEGLKKYYDVYAWKIADNQVAAIVSDITQHKKDEQALRANEHLYRTVFDNGQDGFQLIQLIYDKNGKPIDHKFLKINKAYEKIIGVRAEQIIDKTARAISPNAEPYWFEIPDEVIKTGQTQHVEIYNKDINKWLDCYYFPYSKDTAGTLFRDITERVNLQRQLQEKERFAAIGETAGMVGHDIRNPLQAMISDVYLMTSELNEMPECGTKEGIRESLESLETNIMYVNKIVGDLQDYTRPLQPHKVQVKVTDKVSNALKNVRIPQDIRLHVNAQQGLVIETDADYLRRALTNLINNAIQAMPTGGDLTIEAKAQDSKVMFSVQDTGVGISEDVKPNLFKPLFTTKSKGQGLGLAVVKRLVEALGGTIAFVSEQGKGTEFIIELPITQ
jgi:nitrogen-specific signal transduction histidine kinase